MSVSPASTKGIRVPSEQIRASRVFVVGCTGSGVTLLRLMLSVHPAISISTLIAPYDRYDVPHLDSLFPDCNFILLVRDPRDVFACGKRDVGWDFLTFTNELQRSVVDGLVIESSVGPTRVIHVRYEDLITTPRIELHKICRFLGVEYSDELINSFQHELSVAASHREREVLTQEERDGICAQLHSPMRLLGYLSYEEYDHYSRRRLSKIAILRSQSLETLSVSRLDPPQPSPRLEVASRHWMEIPPVFIVGHGRSGTTLLRMMLSAHPKIFISSEGAYICSLRSQISAYGDLRDRRNLDALHKSLSLWLDAVNFLCPPEAHSLFEWVDRFGCDERSLITFYGTWEARALGRHDLAWWGDNEPSHVHNVPYLKSLFPNSKLILMIRDPRDVYASFKSAWPGIHTAESIAIGWERCLLDGLLAASRLGRGLVHQVKYEDLVINPEVQLRTVCKFLNVEYTDTMMTFHELEAAKHLSQVEHHRNVAQPLFRNSVGRFCHILNQDEITAIQDRLYVPMTCFGYLSHAEYQEIRRNKIRRDAQFDGKR
jgi:sulfotransferase family protein